MGPRQQSLLWLAKVQLLRSQNASASKANALLLLPCTPAAVLPRQKGCWFLEVFVVDLQQLRSSQPMQQPAACIRTWASCRPSCDPCRARLRRNLLLLRWQTAPPRLALQRATSVPERRRRTPAKQRKEARNVPWRLQIDSRVNISLTTTNRFRKPLRACALFCSRDELRNLQWPQCAVDRLAAVHGRRFERTYCESCICTPALFLWTSKGCRYSVCSCWYIAVNAAAQSRFEIQTARHCYFASEACCRISMHWRILFSP